MSSITGTGETPEQIERLSALKMNDGKTIPYLAYGLGTARVNRNASDIDEELVNLTVEAIKMGYTHLDGAEVYGNEAELGMAIKKSGVDRSKLFVTTKLRSNKNRSTAACLQESLKKLQLDYVDLYLIHSPFFLEGSKEALQQQWAEMEDVLASGKAKSIGVSNYLQEHVEAILETAKVKPAINQIEFHPYLQHGNLLAWHQEKGIAVSAYGPLTAIVRAKPGPCDVVYERLAKKYGVSEAEVALRWCIDQQVVTITTSSNLTRLKGYLTNLPTFKLTPAEVEEIKEKGEEKHYRGFWTARFAKDDRR